jgi:CheY-like chemotaxis protein
LKDDQVWAADLESRNGTLLNGKPLTDGLPLHDGDELNLAGLPFRVCLTAQTAASDEPHRVLVVEDDEDAAETLAVLLKRWGHEVHVAHNGPEALKAAQAHQPDTVLVDIWLPGMDGYEVAERLRRQPGAEPALMVAMSGHEGERSRPQTHEAQFDEFLIKPVDTRMLQEVFAR